MKLLCVDENLKTRELVQKHFQKKGHLCELAADFQTASANIDQHRYDCIILNIHLPDGSGFEILKRIKYSKHKDGVIILTSSDALQTKLFAFKMGADDYLTKPFHVEELEARASAIISRRLYSEVSMLEIGEITINLKTNTVSVRQSLIDLTQKEYDLLLFFIANKEKLVRKTDILGYLWGPNSMKTPERKNFNRIYSHIGNLRRKLFEVSGKDYIESAHGMGYRLLV